MATKGAAAACNEILQEWEASLKSFAVNRKNGNHLLPTALQLYKLGLFLQALSSNMSQYANVLRTYHGFLQTIPDEYRKHLFADLNLALLDVLREEDGEGGGLEEALESLSQLYSGSSLAAAESSEWEIETNLSALVERYNENMKRTAASIISLLAIYLNNCQDFEQILPALHLMQENDQIWKHLVQHLESRNRHWREHITAHFPDESQQEYLVSLLATTGHADEEALASHLKTATRIRTSSYSDNNNNKAAAKPVAPVDEIQRRIDQVRLVLPDLGEGFVEAALSCFNGNVETTVQALLDDESSLPATLQVTDRKLPRRQRRQETSAAVEKEEQEAREIAKLALQAAQKQEEKEAYMVDTVMRTGGQHDEYNDDYDDQYDDQDGVGNTDTGLYDDYDAVQAYNRAVKQAGAEQTFWEENRNTNRQNNNKQQQQTKTTKSKTSADGEKSYRGPDKMRGGRVPGRGGRGGGRGGRGGRGQPRSANNSDDDDDEKGGGEDSNAKKKPNLRSKARKMDKRRDQQKKAQIKRSG